MSDVRARPGKLLLTRHNPDRATALPNLRCNVGNHPGYMPATYDVAESREFPRGFQLVSHPVRSQPASRPGYVYGPMKRRFIRR